MALKLSTKSKLIIALIFWILFLGIDILKKSIFKIEDLNYVYYFYLVGFVIWFIISIPLYAIFQQSHRLSPIIRALSLFLLGPIIAGLKVILSWASYYGSISLSGNVQLSFMEFLTGQSTFHYVEATIIVWVVMLLFYLSELYLKYQQKLVETAELEARLYQSQLQALKMQLQPHFLFNAQNTITMLIRTKMYDQAIEMNSKLSDLLRATLENKADQFVRLEEEISLLRKYLDIELIRFEDTLSIDIDIENAAGHILVPNMILQPLVENAIKHGISKHLGKSCIAIQATTFNKTLIVKIFNTGPKLKLPFNLKTTLGIGLKNVLERLTKCYENNFKFEIVNQGNGVCCQMEFPIQDA